MAYGTKTHGSVLNGHKHVTEHFKIDPWAYHGMGAEYSPPRNSFCIGVACWIYVVSPLVPISPHSVVGYNDGGGKVVVHKDGGNILENRFFASA